MIPAHDAIVYAVGVDGGPIKVGYTANMKERMVALQTGQHQDLVIFHQTRLPMSAARATEAGAHRRLARTRLRGEWFSAPLSDVVRAIEDAYSAHLDDERGDGLDQLGRLGWVVGRQMEAARAYRELREVAGRSGMVTQDTRPGGSPSKVVDARRKLTRLDQKVLGRCGAKAAALLVAVASRGRSIDMFADTEDAWELAAHLVSKALDVVADELDAAISA